MWCIATLTVLNERAEETLRQDELDVDGSFLVTLLYDPGFPISYLVNHAPSGHEARKAALAFVGYNPGVGIRVERYQEGKPVTVRYAIEYTPLTRQTEEAIRYND